MNEPSENKSLCQLDESAAAPETAANDRIKPGDTVLILSMDEIEKTLNEKKTTEGVLFFAGMERYAGTKAKVLKEVGHIFDERAWRLLRCKNMFILEGLYCDGKYLSSKEGCERRCFYYWKTAWLRKL